MSQETESTHPTHPNAPLLSSAIHGFDCLFSNDIAGARKTFKGRDDPFHVMGMGICAFLEAALGMETGLMAEASRCLSLAEAGTRQQMRIVKPQDLDYHSRFHYGLEWEILNADAVVLLGLTHALSESYMGYLQCLYSLNSAHSKFTKLYKTVFPNGVHESPPLDLLSPSGKPSHLAPPGGLSHKPSLASLSSQSSIPPPRRSFFSRLISTGSTASLPIQSDSAQHHPDGPVEDLIEAGTAFGFGLFNLVFSLLPKKIQGVVGFFGFESDRKLALKVLAYSAKKNDIHGVFSGLVLMTYHGAVLLLAGYQADEKHILEEYRNIVDRVDKKYPTGALWILNKAKILRMDYDPEGAIKVLQDGLRPDREHSFVQADTLLMFELAWTLLSQRRYTEAAEAFIKLTGLNSWSHGTYYFIAAGSYIAIGDLDKAQKLIDQIPGLIDKRKLTGKDLPTEVLIKKKLAFYKEKHIRKGGDGLRIVDCIKICPAEEIGIFWNTHSRIPKEIAQQHIDTLSAFTPIPKVSDTVNTKQAAVQPKPTDDLDTIDEVAIRALILGVNYRRLGRYAAARNLLLEAHQYPLTLSTWVGGVALFELAVLELKEMEDISVTLTDDAERKKQWAAVLKSATGHIDQALSLSTNAVDLSGRLDSRIGMLRDQISIKKEALAI